MRYVVMPVLCCAVAFGPAARAQEPATTEPTVAFVDVSVIPMDRERVLKHQTVVVRGRHITALGPVTAVEVPTGAARIDGRGKFLMPGLADMHNHTNQWFAFLASGITTVRNPGGGEGAKLRAQVTATQLPGPHVYAFGSVSAESPAGAVDNVLQIKAAGDEAVKLPVAKKPEYYDSVLAAARRVNLKLVGHVPLGPTLEDVLASGQWSSIEHLTGYVESVIGVSGRWTYDGGYMLGGLDYQTLVDTAVWMKPTFKPQSSIHRLAAATRRAGVWNCPTLLANFGQLLSLPESALGGASPQGVARRAIWRQFNTIEFDVVKALQDAGAGLLLGSDAGPYGAHQELQLLVQTGLTPYQALATGTRNVAAFLGTLDSTGTVAVGKLADLVLLDANPLQDIRRTTTLAGVMAAGRWLPRAELDARLDPLIKTQRDSAWQHPVADIRSGRFRPAAGQVRRTKAFTPPTKRSK